jgi:hypothetical protein
MIQISRDKTDAWNILLLIWCLWLGYQNEYRKLSFVIDIIFHPAERTVFIKWFEGELHYPMLLITKGSEFAEELYGRGKYSLEYLFFWRKEFA